MPSAEATPSAHAADAACRGREGDPGRPQGGRSAAAGADITPATGRGRFAPTPTRHAADGVQSDKKDTLRVTAKRGVRGCRGCRGAVAPLTPCPAPGRRPAARSGQQPRCKEEKKKKNNNSNNNDDMPATAGAKKGCPHMTDIPHSNAGEGDFLPLRQKNYRNAAGCVNAQSRLLTGA